MSLENSKNSRVTRRVLEDRSLTGVAGGLGDVGDLASGQLQREAGKHGSSWGLTGLAGRFFFGDGKHDSLSVAAENDPAERKTLMRQKKGGGVFRSKVLEKWRGTRMQCSSSGMDTS